MGTFSQYLTKSRCVCALRGKQFSPHTSFEVTSCSPPTHSLSLAFSPTAKLGFLTGKSSLCRLQSNRKLHPRVTNGQQLQSATSRKHLSTVSTRISLLGTGSPQRSTGTTPGGSHSSNFWPCSVQWLHKARKQAKYKKKLCSSVDDTANVVPSRKGMRILVKPPSRCIPPRQQQEHGVLLACTSGFNVLRHTLPAPGHARSRGPDVSCSS